MRQGCPVSPCIFILLLADLKKLKKGAEGGIKMKGRKIFSQEYANDVTVVAEDEGEMIRVMEKYVERKGL